MERNLRYVELNAAGQPFHENWKSWSDGPTEDVVYAELVAIATERGHTLVRIVADDPKRDRNPDLSEIEGNGRGGIRAKAGKPNALDGITVIKNA